MVYGASLASINFCLPLLRLPPQLQLHRNHSRTLFTIFYITVFTHSTDSDAITKSVLKFRRYCKLKVYNPRMGMDALQVKTAGHNPQG